KVSRPQFKWEKKTVDSSGRTLHYFPRHKQVLRQLLQIPFMVFATVVLGAIILAVFALETLISDAYEGPYKDIIVRAPASRLMSRVFTSDRNMSPQSCWVSPYLKLTTTSSPS